MRKTTPKLALVTGSSKGIGFYIAKELNERDVSVILTSRNGDHLKDAFVKLNSKKNLSYVVDFSDEERLKNFLDTLIEERIIPDILIHNVGLRLEDDTFPINLDVLHKTLRINLEASIKINEAFMPFMKKKKFGRVVHISSNASLTGRASPAYVISKSAMNAYVKCLARQVAKDQIMVCAVLPGIIEHEGSVWANKKIESPDYYQSRLKETLLGRFGSPCEIAQFVAGLVTSKNMMCTGGLFELCGGI